MASTMSDAVRIYAQEKEMDSELVFEVIELALRAAYKKKFGTDSNVVFRRENGEVIMFSRKNIVDEVQDDVYEIALEKALKLMPGCAVGDELMVEVDPESFTRVAVQAGMQRAQQYLIDIQKENLEVEYSSKIGEVIIGYYQRERNGNIYVDLGKSKVEGFLPKRFQSPRESYGPNNRIKALICEVKKQRRANIVQVVLSRTDPEFVKRILEVEIPEVYDGIVEVVRIVREPGYRTKLAVVSNREDVDPVGACVGAKGSRIQNVIAELEGEKIDVLNFSPDPKEFIAYALSPAEVQEVILLDEEKRSALAVVTETQLSLAIGKRGLNVRLANQLSGWNIDIKTEKQFAEMDIYTSARQAAEELFASAEYEDMALAEIEYFPTEIVSVLQDANINTLNELDALSDEEIQNIPGMTPEMADTILNFLENDEFENEDVEDESLVEESVLQEEVMSDEEIVSESELEEYADVIFECPECGGDITIDMTECPHCHVGLEFEYEEEE